MALRGLASHGLIRRLAKNPSEWKKQREKGAKEIKNSINIILPFRLNIDSTFYDVDGRYYVQLAL